MNLAKYISHKEAAEVQMFFDGKLIGEVQPLIIWNNRSPVTEIGSFSYVAGGTVSPNSAAGLGIRTSHIRNNQR